MNKSKVDLQSNLAIVQVCVHNFLECYCFHLVSFLNKTGKSFFTSVLVFHCLLTLSVLVCFTAPVSVAFYSSIWWSLAPDTKNHSLKNLLC